ncbi:MAG: hypothetical protein KC588_19385, partial [Nitrospira sp.]|nr:hypothetical protein [Nitrospira sp.]
WNKQGGTLAGYGEAQLMVRPMLLRLLRVFTLTPGRAADIPLGGQAPRQDGAEVSQLSLNAVQGAFFSRHGDLLVEPIAAIMLSVI